MKIAVLMTDGEYNTVGGIMSGANETLSGEMAVATCAGMKSEDIIVYTVGFMIDNAAAINVLSQCASDSSKFFRAENGDDLRRAFRAIAEDITNVWLMK
jgi:hypothetical protein